MFSRENLAQNRIGVYDPGMSLKGEPARDIAKEDARRIINNGEARKCCHGKAIVLFRAQADLDCLKDKALLSNRYKGLSLKPNDKVMTRALDGSLPASIACSSWAGPVVRFNPRGH